MATLIDKNVSAIPSEAAIDRMDSLCKVIERPWLPDFSLHLTELELHYEPQIYLFRSMFPQLGEEKLADLSLALRFCVYATLLTDKVIDRPKDTAEAARKTLRIQALQYECYHILYRLFSPHTEFWRRFRILLSNFTQACLEERRFADGTLAWETFTEERGLKIIRGKNSLARLLAASLVEMSGDDRQYSNLQNTIEKYYIAWQLWDDLCDWKEDFRDGVPTLLLAGVADRLPSPENREKQIPHLARKIYYEGHALRTLSRAISLIDEADQHVVDFPDLAWRGFISELRAKCVNLHEDLARIAAKNVQRARGQQRFELTVRANRDLFEQGAWRALSFLTEQWNLGFGEAQHVAYMARELGYRGSTEFPSGDIFQRALITDALCDANEWLDGQLQPVIDAEVNYLLSQRSESGVGGWRYFPSVPELAPDADDLGQVMQALLRAGRKSAVKKHCEAPMAMILEDSRRRGGPFSTWIIPAESRSDLEEVQDWLRGNNWGPGPDGEVMANLLYALGLYDRARFAEFLDRGCEFLAASQQEDGSWSSKWYYGPYYGTYVCLRLLSTLRPDCAAIAVARSFLHDQQRQDGGWGYGDESDPLSTALALLGLASIPSNSPRLAGEWTWQALRYLERVRDTDDGWPSVPFISIPVYGSRTVTTLYVLKACLAWRGQESEVER